MRHSTNPWVILVLICFAQFMVVLDATVVNVALPSIQRDLHMSEADLQWIVNSYTLVFGGFLLLGGRAGDLLGRKRLFLFGLVVFTIASLLDGLSQSSGMLIGSRALQRLGRGVDRRRCADAVALLAVDLLHQRPRRDRRLLLRAPRRARVAGRRGAPQLRRRGRGHG